MTLSCERRDAADLPVLDHGTVAVEEDYRRAAALLDVMEPDALDVEEASPRRMLAFRPTRATLNEESGAAEGCRGDKAAHQRQRARPNGGRKGSANGRDGLPWTFDH
jgi:hypothetical protein